MFTPMPNTVKFDLETGLRVMELRPHHVLASRRTRGALIQIMACRSAARPAQGTRASNTGHRSLLNLLMGLFLPRKPVLHG